MQSMLNLRATHGVPLCLSGITNNPLALSKEMADHDRRRKAIRRRQRSQAREGLHANQEKGTHTNSERDSFVEDEGDLDDILHDLSHAHHLGLTAKAA
ncbi:hypothetical protein SESBI_44894 [Sesbania bispinosa]|nr:hypothetical protein SESBI_44894 [Sesbania bispinosa]